MPEKAEGNKARALTYYNHRRTAAANPNCKDSDHREKWPMLAPSVDPLHVGTIGVLLLVYGFLANRLGW